MDSEGSNGSFTYDPIKQEFEDYIEDQACNLLQDIDNYSNIIKKDDIKDKKFDDKSHTTIDNIYFRELNKALQDGAPTDSKIINARNSISFSELVNENIRLRDGVKDSEGFWADYDKLQEKLDIWMSEGTVPTQKSKIGFQRGMKEFYKCVKSSGNKKPKKLSPESLNTLKKLHEDNAGNIQRSRSSISMEKKKKTKAKKTDEEIIHGNYGIKEILYDFLSLLANTIVK